jgi:CheY-like chemotaxis protein
MSQPLGGLSVLIVEDEVIIGLMLFNEIARAGGTSIGPVTSVAGALKEIESRIVDAVILDAKLIDGSGADLAALLKDREIPYVVISGYDEANLPRELRGAPFVSKPISLPVLVEAIEGLPVASERDSSRRLLAGPLATPSHSPGSEETGPRSLSERAPIMPSPGTQGLN